MRISDWSSDVCSSDLIAYAHRMHDSFGDPRYDHHALGARQGGQQWLRRGQHIARNIVLDNQKAVTLGQLQQLERARHSETRPGGVLQNGRHEYCTNGMRLGKAIKSICAYAVVCA